MKNINNFIKLFFKYYKISKQYNNNASNTTKRRDHNKPNVHITQSNFNINA